MSALRVPAGQLRERFVLNGGNAIAGLGTLLREFVAEAHALAFSPDFPTP